MAAVEVHGIRQPGDPFNGGGTGVALDFGDASAGQAGLVAWEAKSRACWIRIYHFLAVDTGTALIKFSARAGVAVHVAADTEGRYRLQVLSREAAEAVGSIGGTGLTVGVARRALPFHRRACRGLHEVSARAAGNAHRCAEPAAGDAIWVAAVAVIEESACDARGTLTPQWASAVLAIGVARETLCSGQIAALNARGTRVGVSFGAGLAVLMAADPQKGWSRV